MAFHLNRFLTGLLRRNMPIVSESHLHTGNCDMTVGLTISIGKWWDDTALNERHWILLMVKPSTTNFDMRVEEPEVSCHADFKALAIALSRDEALSSDLKDDFFAVADYIVVEDPAVNSYLMGKEVNIPSRVCKALSNDPLSSLLEYRCYTH